MKRQILFLTAALTAAVLAGCSTTDNAGNENQNGSSGSVVENVVPNHGNTQQDTENNNQNTSSGTSQNEGEGQDYKMGVGIVSRLKRAQNAEDTDGSAEINTVVAAVTVDREDRIINCIIDKVENKLSISNTGSIGSVANTEYPTTKELGDSYGMKGASPIGKEWNEQIASFEQYVIGKTVEEVNGIETDDQGYAQENDLTSSVTISISDFQAAITKAVENAR
ncbi:MAG: hypothetical protein HFI22_14600 [Lachnospiraceae bacterium]|jgi:hypothetical protein|nr:hypothetical protein [Lachnospiraceae bacterium]